ncbi:pyridoxal phosphate-dependent aminotransferase family protein [Frankia sp. CNm7]|uniref:8-amino-7-oxononanoate synthase n=1 Tax=Frankia nepalensis TaxID=1836974 RepID=A0A937RBL2_9ACTN|nr:pyridoxal phosphate-dependent aminotransferase family protein [Frankia nepalensis]MBL7499701.1 pyridoxal phosphate-dependent aminotransferase family protein [Frankia nepalensis]MBL7515007.1 pyridoxal phosphate-dependent aminotransferase family protein [Frankia nepalensis]MBL7521313.1 pyridoxal phosphate-dependent aminotransferase family protein [Frankia nepalensis]MBL7629133.1 pyridoxal phosphate-dependent aminotransferase family protein [Frankia nepalensis]
MGDRDEAVASYTTDPYPVWETGQRYGDSVRPGGLLDSAPVREWFSRLDEVRQNGLYTFGLPQGGRGGRRTAFGNRDLISFSNYSYLSLNGHPKILAAAHDAVERYGTGTGGARLLAGTTDLHRETEAAFARWLGTEDAVLANAGYDANLAAISGLFGPRDLALVDEFAHRSLVDGCRLAGLRVHRFRHNDVGHLEELAARHGPRDGRKLVIVEGVYSMDGDQAPLAEIVELKERHGFFLLLDDAHALGVLGAEGRGTAAEQGVDIARFDIVTASLSKAFPSVAGVVAGTKGLGTYLRHGASPFMFSAATSPANTATILATLDVLVSEPEHLAALRRNSAALGELVRRAAGTSHDSTSPVVPVLLGASARAYTWARVLLDEGVHVLPVPAPAVPEGRERLRLCATAGHTAGDLARLEAALLRCVTLEQDEAELRDYLASVASRSMPAPDPA